MKSLARNLGRSIIEKSASSGRRMKENESFTLLSLLAPIDKSELEELHESAMKQIPIYAIMSHRIDATSKADVSVAGKIFLSEIASGNPGNAVMLSAVVAELSEDGTRPVSLNDIIEAFPMLVPTSEIFGEVWDTQKGGTHDGMAYDNALDHAWAWNNA
jgi:hypothetical protein